MLNRTIPEAKLLYRISTSWRLGVLLPAAVAALTLAAPAASAATSDPSAARPNMCPAETWSQIDSHSNTFVTAPGESWTGGPGGNLSVTTNRSTTLETTISASATISLDELVADASATVSASATKSDTTSINVTYSHEIPSGTYGTINYCSYAFYVHWSQWRQNGNCTSTELASGTGKVLAGVGFQYVQD